MEIKDTRLIYVYDSCGTLVNGKPFVGFESVVKYLHGEVSELTCQIVSNNIKIKCMPNGDMLFNHYFRTRPTTVFKSKVKFYSLKLKG